MKKICILIADNALASSAMNYLDFFAMCNSFWHYAHQSHDHPINDIFECTLVSPEGGKVTTNQGITLDTQKASMMLDADAVLISSAYVYEKAGIEQYIKLLAPTFPLIHQCAAVGKVVGAYCSATFVLAATGLLNNKSATTVWWLNEQFQANFPDIKLDLNSLVVQQNNLFTGGATTSSTNLCLEVIRELVDDTLAQNMAKIMLTESNRMSQVPYMLLDLTPHHHDDTITRVQSWMQKNLSAPFSLDELSNQFAMSKRNLIRRFKQAVGETPLNYLQKLRVEKAKRLLESSNDPIDKIVHQVGYSDASSFRKLFIEQTQISPKVYRERFNAHCC